MDRFNTSQSFNQLGRRRRLLYPSMLTRANENISSNIDRNRIYQNAILNRYSSVRNPFVIDLDSPRLVEGEGLEQTQDHLFRICYMHSKVSLYYE